MRKFLFFLVIVFFSSDVFSFEPIELRTKKGIKFWYVKDTSVPIISLDFGFLGGAFYDLDGKEGTSTFLASILDEGAGDLNSVNFQKMMNSLGMKLRFSSTKDLFSGKFQTVSENKEKSFDLLKLVFLKPRFDKNEIEKIRNQLIASYKINNSNISDTASIEFYNNFFKGHKFSRNDDGNLDSLRKVNFDELNFFFKNFLTRKNLILSISGDIDQDDAIKLIDDSFGLLPESSENIKEIPKKNTFESGIKFVEKKTPQSAVVFGQRGLPRKSEDFFAARICNYVMGGGGFQSRLYKNIRERRGLTYSIYSYFISHKNNDILLGGFQTKNESVNETIKLVKSEWKKMSINGISQEELNEAKTYYKGSFTRNYASTSTISSLLNAVQLYGLSIDYFEKRNKIIDNLTLEKVNRVAREIFQSENLFFLVVGNDFD